ncbi:MAG: hypothetical protein ACYCQI_16400, partial [Gammaproteobacteria bacterium]
AKPLLNELQQLLTGMRNGNLGIGNVSDSSKIAYDIHQVIRYQLAWDKEPCGDVGVSFDPPMKWGSQPLAKIEKHGKE